MVLFNNFRSLLAIACIALTLCGCSTALGAQAEAETVCLKLYNENPSDDVNSLEIIGTLNYELATLAASDPIESKSLLETVTNIEAHSKLVGGIYKYMYLLPTGSDAGIKALEVEYGKLSSFFSTLQEICNPILHK